MRKPLQSVIKWFKDWENLIFWFIVILFLISFIAIFIPELRVIHNIGIPISSFGVITGSIATVCGALIGLLVAAMLFLMQYASTNFSDTESRLVNEKQWLDTKLLDKKILTKNITAILKSLCQTINVAGHMFPSDFKCGEARASINKASDSIKKYCKTVESKTNKIDEKSREIGAGRTRVKMKARLESIGATTALTLEVANHLLILAIICTRVETLSLIPIIINSLKLYIRSFVIIAILALISLLFGTIVFPNNSSLTSDFSRMLIAAFLIVWFSFTLKHLLELISINWRVIGLTMGVEQED